MSDFIVFTVGTNAYAIDVAYVERIIQIPNITPVVNAHRFVDGMIVYQNKTVKILNFRKATGMHAQEEELAKIFLQVKKDHEIWVEALRDAIGRGADFTLTTDSHACRLGKWLDSYSSHDPEVISLLQTLQTIHARLHEMGKEMLEYYKEDPERARDVLAKEIATIYGQTTAQLDLMIRRSADFAKYQQKLIIYNDGGEIMAVKVDGIDDIAVIDESMIKQYDHPQTIGTCLKTRGVVEHKGNLVIVVESISMPREES